MADLSGRAGEGELYWLGFQNVAVDRIINKVTALTGFSYNKMYMCFTRTKKWA